MSKKKVKSVIMNGDLMKSIIFGLVLSVVPFSAFAGSSQCTDVANITSGGNVNLTSSHCILNVTAEDAVAFSLPSGLSVGDEITIEVNTPFTNDSCDQYQDEETLEIIHYCWPATTSIVTASGDVVSNLSNSTIVELVGFYSPLNPYRQRVKFVKTSSSEFEATFYESN